MILSADTNFFLYAESALNTGPPVLGQVEDHWGFWHSSVVYRF